MARLFFAIWPSKTVSASLFKLAEQLQHSCGGRIPRRESFHLTLLFLGDVPRSRMPDLMHAADQIRAMPFCLCLEEFACWRHNRIGYAAPATLPAELESLVVTLRQQVAAAGFGFDKRQFAAHVTLLRNVAKPIEHLSVPTLEWRMRKFVLVESVPGSAGVHYVESKSWPLG